MHLNITFGQSMTAISCWVQILLRLYSFQSGKTALPAAPSGLADSEPHATAIPDGHRIPHPRHWQSLARLVGNM